MGYASNKTKSSWGMPQIRQKVHEVCLKEDKKFMGYASNKAKMSWGMLFPSIKTHFHHFLGSLEMSLSVVLIQLRNRFYCVYLGMLVCVCSECFETYNVGSMQ